MRRLLVLLVLLLVTLPTPAHAHPLGNFSVNTADRVLVTADGIDVLHVIDIAEIPTVQLAPRLAAGVAAYAAQECARIQPLLELTADGRLAALTAAGATAARLPGQAGLETLRLECRFTSTARPRAEVALTDRAATSRTGWQEITIATACGRVSDSDVPQTSASDLLRRYPEDLLASPPRTTSGRAALEPGPCRTVNGDAARARDGVTRSDDGLTRAFTGLVDRESTGLGFGLLALALSVLFGAVHALAPGHGKTLVAAYLVGQRGTPRQAIWLGAAVTVSHTGSVLLLGALLSVGAIASPERVVPVSEVVSGALLIALGSWLLWRAVRARRARHSHTHDHGDQHHDHGQGHGHGHGQGKGHHHDHHEQPENVPRQQRSAVVVGAQPGPTLAVAPASDRARTADDSSKHSHGPFGSHTHAPATNLPLGWRSLAATGLAAGLVPSPSALLVLLGATALGRAPFGVLLVIGYGLGMALTLTVAGLLLLRLQSRLTGRFDGVRRLQHLAPIVAAVVVVAVGTLLALRGAGLASKPF